MEENQHHSKTWLPEAEETLRILWKTVEPHLIARIVNAWLFRVFMVERHRNCVTLFSGSSVIDRAYRLNLIDEQTMIAMKIAEKARHRKAMKNATMIGFVTKDGSVQERALYDFEPSSSFTYDPRQS
jgi:hypothetical protein